MSALALPLAAVLVLDASAFEVALLGTVEFLPFLLFALPAGVWVDRLRRRPILIVTDLCRGLVPRLHPGRVPPRRADDLAALRRRLSRRHLHGLLRRLVPVVSPFARSQGPARGGKLAARGVAQRGPDRRAGNGRGARRRHHGSVRHPRRRRQLRRVSRPARRDSHRGRATAGDGEAEHVGRAARRARIPRPSSLLAADLDHDRQLELLLDAVRLDHHRLRGARARPFPGSHRADVLARQHRRARRRVHRQARVDAIRRRPDDRRLGRPVRPRADARAAGARSPSRSRCSSRPSSWREPEPCSTTSAPSASCRRSRPNGCSAGSTPRGASSSGARSRSGRSSVASSPPSSACTRRCGWERSAPPSASCRLRCRRSVTSTTCRPSPSRIRPCRSARQGPASAAADA